MEPLTDTGSLIVQVISKLLSDLVARNDQVSRRGARCGARAWCTKAHAPLSALAQLMLTRAV